MNKRENFEGDWEQIKNDILNQWEFITESEIIQSEGINELTGIIANKHSEPRPNVLHELIHIFRTYDPHHPILEKYFEDSNYSRRSEGGDELNL